MSQIAVVPELDAELDRLFELLPPEFTAARNDLARRLKRAGQSDAAARVQALRKPTIPVWAINQLARRHADAVEALITAGDELRAAQQAALAGGGREQLRAATSAEREAVRTLTQRAQELLKSAGQRPTHAVLERTAATLRAAALDARGRELLAAGMLAEELESTGFGAFEGMRVPAPRKQPKPKRTGAAEQGRRKEQVRKLRERAKTLEEEAVAAAREAKKAEASAERARREAERKAAAADRARADLHDLEQELSE